VNIVTTEQHSVLFDFEFSRILSILHIGVPSCVQQSAYIALTGIRIERELRLGPSLQTVDAHVHANSKPLDESCKSIRLSKGDVIASGPFYVSFNLGDKS
jgi:hypothetical protein